VSLDDGKHWQSLRLNMPVTPITDLQVHDTDLVVSTLGRSFWILDDVSPLQQDSKSYETRAAHLFQPRIAFRTNIGGTGGGDDERSSGTNSPAGAIINYYVSKEAPVTIEILNSFGEVLRRYSSQAEQSGRQTSIKVKPGMNRHVWDLRYGPLTQVRGAPALFRMGGRIVKPGTYTIRMNIAGETLSAPIDVRMDPRWIVSAEEFSKQDEMLAAIERDVADLNQNVLRIRSVRDQIANILKGTAGDSVVTRGKQLAAKLEEIEDALIQKNPSGGQRAVVEPSRLSSHFNFLHVSINRFLPEVTGGEKDLYSELAREFAEYKTQLAKVLGSELEAYNQVLAKQGISPIVPKL
jgi:hypothetical protein